LHRNVVLSVLLANCLKCVEKGLPVDAIGKGDVDRLQGAGDNLKPFGEFTRGKCAVRIDRETPRVLPSFFVIGAKNVVAFDILKDCRAANVPVCDASAGKVGPSEVCTESLASCQVNMLEMGSLEIGSLEVDSLEVCSLEVNSLEVSTLKICSLEVNSLEIDSLEVGTLEVDSLEISILEARAP
jgi:hypothetical protein